MVLEKDLSLVNKVNRLLGWGHWFTFFNILLTLLISGSYFLADPLPHTGIGWLYLLLNWFGHTAFLCFLFFIMTVFPVSLLFPSQKHVRGIGAVLATSAMVALIFDAYVYHTLGYHAGSAAWEQTVDLLRQQVVTNLRNFVLITSTVFAVILAIQLVLSNFCWKKMERLRHAQLSRPALVFFLACFALSHLLHVWGDAMERQDITRQDHVLPFSYPTTARGLLARYELLDAGQLIRGVRGNWLEQQGIGAHPVQLRCEATSATPLEVWVVRQMDSSVEQLLKLQHFKFLPQHLAPVDPHIAVINLLQGALEGTADLTPAAWLSQIPSDTWHYQIDSSWPELTAWQSPSATPATVKWQFATSEQLLEQLKQRGSEKPMLVLSLAGSSQRFALGRASMAYYWPDLQRQQLDQVSQHLDLVPTLLAYIGCHNQQQWVGNDWFSQPGHAQLNLIGRELFAFRKDKMLILQENGQFSVYSAGTEVQLESRPDWPMLTEALNRLPRAPLVIEKTD